MRLYAPLVITELRVRYMHAAQLSAVGVSSFTDSPSITLAEANSPHEEKDHILTCLSLFTAQMPFPAHEEEEEATTRKPTD